MRTLFNTVLAAILSAALIGAPAMAAPARPASAPLGVVLQADRAQLGADITSGGATIYDGDRLQTTSDGTLRARLGGPEIYLHANTIAQVHGLPNGFSAELTEGSVVVSATPGQTFQLKADGAVIRPSGSQQAAGQITRISASELVLTGTHGTLEVTMGDEVRTVEAGHSYRMDVESDASADAGPQGSGPYHTARNRFIWIAVAAIAAGTAIGVWRALVSPSAP